MEGFLALLIITLSVGGGILAHGYINDLKEEKENKNK